MQPNRIVTLLIALALGAIYAASYQAAKENHKRAVAERIEAIERAGGE